MSIQTRTQETVSDEPTDNHTDIDLNEIVAQSIPLEGDLPDFEQFNAVCQLTRDTIERLSEEAI